MTIMAAQELAYRQRIRRRLTLDLFTRYGSFWETVAEVRERWNVTATVATPQEPTFHAASVLLLSYAQMPERFHMPPMRGDEYPRMTTGMFLDDLQHLWRIAIPEDIRSGTNTTGWMSWAPFLSACILYDPPSDALLQFADHDDHHAASLPLKTAWQIPTEVIEATHALHTFVKERDTAAGLQYVKRLRESFAESETVNPPGSRGRPSETLRNVEIACLHRQGISAVDIGDRYGLAQTPYADDYGIQRARSFSAEKAIAAGEDELRKRGI
jgi:hypothetical protein